MKLLLTSLLVPVLIVPAWGQVVAFEPVTTREGCTIQVPTPRMRMFASVDPQGRPSPMTETYTWSGVCAAGTAFGPGTLTYEWRSGSATHKTVNVMTVNAGFRFGHDYTWSEASLSGRTPAEVYFWHGNRVMMFSDGMGLDVSDFERGVTRVTEPRVVPVKPAGDFGQIRSPANSLMLMNMRAFGQASGGAQLRLMDAGGSRTLPCPAPGDLNSCVGLIESSAAPIRDEILAAIRQARAEVDVQYAKVAQALGSTPSGAAPAATGPAASGPSGSATDAFATLPVGALFAAGDEAAAKGDRATAREAFRTLLRRFPDHPLAANAARQLSALQGQ